MASVIAVLGTLLGAGANHLFQQRTAVRGQLLAREERLRGERLEAYAAYAATLVNYRRALVHRWFCLHEDPPPGDPVEARARSYERLNEAEEALFRCRLLADSPTVGERAAEVLTEVKRLHGATDRADLDALRDRTRDRINAWVDDTAASLR
ncbi:hypothetical protein [Streptomyces sp. NBRC 109706]|uniref:hypothetical protein n=1 Tax=Streptomyces sp. NBRC 109706 TaxID=1550035 RepID=UPI000A97F8DF|nr:hypothetical protein [Streptomyces sp. NBRC 109706]